MPEKGRQDDSLAGLVIKEAVERGMETEFRDQIVEAVDTAEGRKSGRARTVPLAGMLVGIGAAIGYAIGRGELEGAETRLREVEPPEIVDEVTEKGEDVAEAVETETVETETETEAGGTGRGRTVGKLVLIAGAVAGLEFLRRRRSGDEEWEPIEEFEPATDADFGGEEDEDESAEEAEATAEGGDESEETEE